MPLRHLVPDDLEGEVSRRSINGASVCEQPGGLRYGHEVVVPIHYLKAWGAGCRHPTVRCLLLHRMGLEFRAKTGLPLAMFIRLSIVLVLPQGL